MAEFVDYYDVLEVSPNARQGVIEKAYRALMLEEHPDRGGDTRRAQLINEAYEVLSDPARRQQYDRERSRHLHDQPSAGRHARDQHAASPAAEDNAPFDPALFFSPGWWRRDNYYGEFLRAVSDLTDTELLQLLDEEIDAAAQDAERGAISHLEADIRIVGFCEAVIDIWTARGGSRHIQAVRESIGCDTCRTGGIPVDQLCLDCGTRVIPEIATRRWGDATPVVAAWKEHEAQLRQAAARAEREARDAAERRRAADENRRRQQEEAARREAEEQQRWNLFWERVEPLLGEPTRMFLGVESRFAVVMFAMVITIIGAWLLAPLLNFLFGIGVVVAWLASAVFTLTAVYCGVLAVRVMQRAEAHRKAYRRFENELPGHEQYLQGTQHQRARRRSLIWTRRNTLILVALLFASSCASYVIAAQVEPYTRQDPATAGSGQTVAEYDSSANASDNEFVGEQPYATVDSAAPSDTPLPADSTPVTVPSISRGTLDEARAALEDAGLRLGKVSRTYDDGWPRVGTVISQNPESGEEVSPGAAVDVVVSKGHTPVQIPNLIGMTLTEANQALFHERGIEVRIASDRTMDSIIYKQVPAPGPAPWPVDEVQLWSDNPPDVDFNLEMEQFDGDEAILVATSTSTDDRGISSYSWGFRGNGLSSSGPRNSKSARFVLTKTNDTYNTPIITLTARDARGSAGSTEHRYMVSWRTGEISRIE